MWNLIDRQAMGTHTYLVVISKVCICVCMCVYTPFLDRTCLSTVYRIHLKSRLKASFQSLSWKQSFSTLTAYRMTRQQFYKTHSLHSTGTTRPTL